MKKLITLLTFTAIFAVIFFACNTKTCNTEKDQYENAKVEATTDSIAFINFKETPPQHFIDIVDYYMNKEGQAEEQAWQSALNLALTDPSTNTNAIEFAQNYTELLEKFNISVSNRENAYNAWQDCEMQK